MYSAHQPHHMKNTILATGGTGYVGAWVVKGLLEKGHTVRLTVRDKPKKKTTGFCQKLLRIQSVPWKYGKPTC